MATIAYGILGGFDGRVGPVIGYTWRGRMCLRARPSHVANPRTEAQQAHRMAFRTMVQLSARMKEAIRVGMRAESLALGMTEQNLFVKLGFGAMGAEGLDYGRLRVSSGPVAGVAVAAVEIDSEGIARLEWEKAAAGQRASGEDEVLLYAYCPAAGCGVLSAPMPRRRKRLAMMLPEGWSEEGVHLYCFVRNYRGECSESEYISTEGQAEGDALGLPDGELRVGAIMGDAGASAAEIAGKGTIVEEMQTGGFENDAGKFCASD